MVARAPLNINGGRSCIIRSCVSRGDGSGRKGGRSPRTISALAVTATSAAVGRRAGRVGFRITAAS